MTRAINSTKKKYWYMDQPKEKKETYETIKNSS
jgi:hypothetical protein